MLLDNLKDIVRATHGLGVVEEVLLCEENGETLVKAMSEGNSVVINGKLKSKIEDLDGKVGLSRLDILSGLVRFPAFETKDSVIEIVRQERNGKMQPTEIKFSSPHGHEASYRFMPSEIAEQTLKIPPFRGVPEWDVVFKPTRQGITDLQYFSGILSKFEAMFVPRTNAKGNLELVIGSSNTDRSAVTFSTEVTGSISTSMKWPIKEFLSILKLAETGDCVIKISKIGALMLEIDTGVGKYEFIMPARG